ncbi:MAG: hypothetical protein AB7S86_15815, partial [Hydrogenophaga sp.]|uniref:hypothetical protein n=1 Tax=Hydrogenophaga sp. TaxID=1904254 RepID=UPI003D14B022
SGVRCQLCAQGPEHLRSSWVIGLNAKQTSAQGSLRFVAFAKGFVDVVQNSSSLILCSTNEIDVQKQSTKAIAWSASVQAGTVCRKAPTKKSHRERWLFMFRNLRGFRNGAMDQRITAMVVRWPPL